MSLKSVREVFKNAGMEEKIKIHELSDTVIHAAEAIGCKPEEIAKTMSFYLDGKPIVICMAGDAKVSNSKYKAYFHEKAKMIPLDKVEEETGHEVGGVTPFACKEGVKVYLDVSLKRFKIVHAAAGSKDSSVGVTMKDLENLTNYVAWIDICDIII